MRQNAPRRPGGVSRAATACYILFAALLLYAAARFSGRVAARELLSSTRRARVYGRRRGGWRPGALERPGGNGRAGAGRAHAGAHGRAAAGARAVRIGPGGDGAGAHRPAAHRL